FILPLRYSVFYTMLFSSVFVDCWPIFVIRTRQALYPSILFNRFDAILTIDPLFLGTLRNSIFVIRHSILVIRCALLVADPRYSLPTWRCINRSFSVGWMSGNLESRFEISYPYSFA